MNLARGFGGGVAAWAVGLLALGAAPQSPQPLPRSTLPVELLAVAVNTSAPSGSSCLVRCAYPGEQPRTALLQIGERACDVAEVSDILPAVIIIRNLLTNHRELVTLAEASAPPGAEAPAETEPPPAPPVVTKSENLVTVELRKDSVSHFLANLPEVLNSALATPHYRDAGSGQLVIDGFEVNRIKEGSVVEQLGIQNGDVILDVNGDALDSMATVVRLVGQVETMAQVKMTVLRNGEKLTFVFNTK